MDVNASTQQLRVALVAMPPLARDIIRTTIAQEPDMCIVAEYDDANDVILAGQKHRTHGVDVVLLGVNETSKNAWAATEDEAKSPEGRYPQRELRHDRMTADPSVPLRILTALPHARVVAVAANGRSAALYVLRPQRQALGEISPKTLVDALRQETKVPQSQTLRRAG
jgi:hypothetical protein